MVGKADCETEITSFFSRLKNIHWVDLVQQKNRLESQLTFYLLSIVITYTKYTRAIG